MKIVGYIVGGLIIAICLGLVVYNAVGIIKAIKQRKKKNNNVTNTDSNNVVEK